MKKSHAGFWGVVALLLVAVLYGVIVFSLKATLAISEWILFVFTMAAFLLLAVHFHVDARRSKTVVLDKLLSIISSLYFAVQFILGGIICMCFSGLPVMPVLVCESILLIGYLVFVFVVYGAQSHSEAQDWNDKNGVSRMRYLERDILGMADAQTDEAKKRALKMLAEDIHFSRVSMNPELTEVEDRIVLNINLLEEELKDDGNDVLDRIETIRNLLKERNRTAAISR